MDAESGETFSTINPSNEQSIIEVAKGDKVCMDMFLTVLYIKLLCIILFVVIELAQTPEHNHPKCYGCA